MNLLELRLNHLLLKLIFLGLICSGFLSQHQLRAQKTSEPASLKFPTIGFASVEEGKLRLNFTQFTPPKVERYSVNVSYIDYIKSDYGMHVPLQKMVEQSYQVTVPYTEVARINGKDVNVTKTRIEKRVRKVPVTVMDPNRPKHLMPVQRTRSEKRKRKIPGTKLERSVLLAPGNLVARALDGKKLDPGTAMLLLAKKTPVLVLQQGESLNSDFRQMLKPNTLIVELPASDNSK